MTITDEQRAEMLEASKPLMAWMNKNCHPHCVVQVDQTSVELTELIANVHVKHES